MSKVLFVNHREKNCGVYQYFHRTVKPVIDSNPERYFYIDVDNEGEHEHWINQLKPNIVVYNYYFSGATMGWLNPQKIESQKVRFKQLCIYHEGSLDHMHFDGIIHQDPSNEDSKYFNISRPIPNHPIIPSIQSVATFGSFGFGLGGKGFDRLCSAVNDQYDAAIIRLQIPYAFFGDRDGAGARNWANICRSKITKPGISLYVSHDLMEERDLVQFLSENSLNVFWYDENYGRGISGTLDYALASRKPLAISKSWQFKHVYSITDKVLIEDKTLQDMIDQGTDHLNVFHERWNDAQLIADFERIFESV